MSELIARGVLVGSHALERSEQSDELYRPLSTVPRPYDEDLRGICDKGYQSQDQANNDPTEDVMHEASSTLSRRSQVKEHAKPNLSTQPVGPVRWAPIAGADGGRKKHHQRERANLDGTGTVTETVTVNSSCYNASPRSPSTVPGAEILFCCQGIHAGYLPTFQNLGETEMYVISQIFVDLLLTRFRSSRGGL